SGAAQYARHNRTAARRRRQPQKAGAHTINSPEQIIYPARTVRTLDPARPTAEAVMVRGSRLRAIGSLDELKAYGPSRIDDRYADAVIFPGMVEAHAHAGSGAMWENTYVGFYPRKDPD